MSQEDFIDALLVGIIAALVGGRLLAVASNLQELSSPVEFFYFWEGGLSLLGGIIAVLLVLPPYLRKKGIPVLPFFDLIALHAPLLQAVSRIGCFLAGCCYGKRTTLLWAITYTDSTSIAPLCERLHPTQLYAALASLITFAFLYFIVQKRYTHAGQLLAIYLMCAGAQRFVLDTFRGDQEFIGTGFMTILTLHQWLSLVLCFGAFVLYLYVSHNATPSQNHESF
jgi:phosphatidylglycerol:prolipoprotein diacylglycerol transferase